MQKKQTDLKVNSSMILVVEDQSSIADTIALYLQNDGFKFKICTTAEQALLVLKNQHIDLMLLDIMLPGKSGLWLLQQNLNLLPIIMLTAKSTEDDIIAGLDLGAVDYITKPFKPREMIARVKTQLRQSQKNKNQPINPIQTVQIGQLKLDEKAMQVYLDGRLMKLTKTEYDLLYCLMKRPNTVITRSQLITQVFGHLYDGNERTIDTHLYNLRKKIEMIPQRPEYIHTIHGIGFKFQYLQSMKS